MRLSLLLSTFPIAGRDEEPEPVQEILQERDTATRIAELQSRIAELESQLEIKVLLYLIALSKHVSKPSLMIKGCTFNLPICNIFHSE